MSFSYFYDNATLSQSNLKFLWEFSDNSGSVVTDTSELALHHGLISDTGSFWSDGSGALWGSENVEVSGATGISTDQFTLIVDAKRIGTDADVLFSSYATGVSAPTGGFSVGFNDTNQLYIETYGGNLQTRTFAMDLPQQAIFALRKTGRDFILSYYDVTSSSVTSESISFASGFYYGAFPMYFGLPTDWQDDGPVTGFSGYLNSLTYINKSLSDKNLLTLLSGFKEYSFIPTGSTQLLSAYEQVRYLGSSLDYADHILNISGLNDALYTGLADNGFDHLRYIYTGSYDNVNHYLTGDLYRYVGREKIYDSVLAYNFPYATIPTINASYSGEVEYHRDDSNGNMVMSNEVFYTDDLAVTGFKVFKDIFKSFSVGPTGEPVVDTGNYINYTMDSLSLVNVPDATGWQVYKTAGVYTANERNKIATTKISPECLLVTTGVTGLNLYDTTGKYVQSSEYAFNGSRLFFDARDVLYSGDYIYDINMTINSVAAPVGAGYDYDFWKGGSVALVDTTSGVLRLNLRQSDYKEVSALSLVSDGSIYSQDSLGLINLNLSDVIESLTDTVWT